MDPLSHAMVGGITASGLCRDAKKLRVAIICGVTAGMSPDLDILLRSADNPMFGLSMHRFFTHALAFAPLGALLIAGILWILLRKPTHFVWMYFFCLCGFGMHGVLDAMTNYGTHLFWPFTDRRESWSIISIIDPIFTGTLLILLSLAFIKKKRQFALIGIAFAMSYWSFGLYQREQATQAMRELAQSRQHTIEHFEVKPSLGNIFVWRVQYRYQSTIYIDAFHVSPWKDKVLYAGGHLPLYTPAANWSPTQQRDLEYFTFFSDGWLAYAPQYPGLIGDVRFSMLPNQLDPIWGIRAQPQKPDAHVTFENVRKRTAGDLSQLWLMIQGHALDE
jgi:inner membrane protein